MDTSEYTQEQLEAILDYIDNLIATLHRNIESVMIKDTLEANIKRNKSYVDGVYAVIDTLEMHKEELSESVED